MILHQPEVTFSDGMTILSARIETTRPIPHFPKYLWFRTPERFAGYFSTQSDAFYLPALQAAMHFGEDLHVRGVVSSRLVYHLDEYQFLQSFAFPKELQTVNVTFDHVAPQELKPNAFENQEIIMTLEAGRTKM